MRYEKIVTGTFVSRPNRFIAMVGVAGTIEKCHVKNTGRCKEILVPGARVILSVSDNPGRKTKYDLIAAYKGEMLINIDSQAPNIVFGEYIPGSGLFGSNPRVHPEYTYGDSRFDFYIESGERRCLAEVKGVTLEDGGVCRFPDAPTERGAKHLRGLMRASEEGYECYAVFIIQMKPAILFAPNYETHEEFGTLLQDAEKTGVKILVYSCDVTPDSVSISSPVPYRLGKE